MKALDPSVIFQFSMKQYIQILIRSGLDFHRLFSLKVKVIDENDCAPDFKNQISENMNLNFCRASLVRGINGDLFDATDKDEKQKLTVTMDGEISDFVKLYKTEGNQIHKYQRTTFISLALKF